ncbi:MAG: hypothetical protein R3D67_18495 [Hyphomicrobiaceae bacterium]
MISLTRFGAASTPAAASTVSAVSLKPVQAPEKRDIAQPMMPKSKTSCTVAG